MCVSDLYLKFRIKCDTIAVFTLTDSYVVYMKLNVLPQYQNSSLTRENADYEKARMSEKNLSRLVTPV